MAKKEVEKACLVVASKVKEEVKGMDEDFRVGGEVADALSDKVRTLLTDAHKRAVANGRKTIKPEDL